MMQSADWLEEVCILRWCGGSPLSAPQSGGSCVQASPANGCASAVGAHTYPGQRCMIQANAAELLQKLLQLEGTCTLQG